MIRKLTERDHEQLFAYLAEEKTFNLFIIGDIENYGYEQEFQEIWGEFDPSGEIKAVLLRYYNNFLPYSKGDFDVEGFASIIRQDSRAEVVSGKQEIVEKFQSCLAFARGKKLYFAELTNDSRFAEENQNNPHIGKATIEDFEEIFALREQIVEFQQGARVRESFREELSAGTARTYVYKESDEILASVSTSAENSFSAMIVGVCTHPKARRRGLATACMQTLCKELLQEGRTLCLLYDNPAAGSIYRRMGFEEIGLWGMGYL